MNALLPARPADLKALTALMAESPPVHFVAGGTDLLISGRQLPATGRLVDLTAVKGLSDIESLGIDIGIGGATTVARIEAHAGLAIRFPALTQAAAQCGSVQIRNRATLGGNIANAAPAADLLPVLALARARLKLLLPGGTGAEIALADFRPGSGALIVTVILSGSQLLPRSAFVKLGSRRDLTIALVNMAAMAEFSDNRFGSVRLMAGALGSRPIRLAHAENALRGQRLAPASLRLFLKALSADVDDAIAGRPSHGWKRKAVRGLGLDLIALLCGLSPRDPLFDEAL
jgi:carbon-monoxide dehydrogenase medium subunit